MKKNWARNIHKNQTGFSLVQVMIAAGILGGLSLVVMKLGNLSQKSVQTAHVGADINDTVMRVSKVLSARQTCEQNFKGKRFGDIVEQIVKDDQNNPVLSRTTSNGKAKVTNIGLNYVGNSTLSVDLTFDRGMMSNGPRNSLRKILLDVSLVNADGTPFFIEEGTAPDIIKRAPKDISEIPNDVVIGSCCCSQGAGEGGGSAKEICEVMQDGVFNEETDKCEIVPSDCEKEKIFLSRTPTGGMTKLCTPNEFIPGTKLVHGLHTREECQKAGGSLELFTHKFVADGSVTPGAPIGRNISEATKTIYACRMKSPSGNLSCPTGWASYQWLYVDGPYSGGTLDGDYRARYFYKLSRSGNCIAEEQVTQAKKLSVSCSFPYQISSENSQSATNECRYTIYNNAISLSGAALEGYRIGENTSFQGGYQSVQGKNCNLPVDQILCY